ncbi:hypothetical protein BD770DRAFT_431267 [Pilaira anomala]|nr:hypothetical protein BD770DRAFT_431267 [Pilaira anomala]
MSNSRYPNPNVSTLLEIFETDDYRNVVLSTMQHVRAFESILRQGNNILGPWVHHIVYNLPDNITIPFPYLIRINSLCTNLKSFRSTNYTNNAIQIQWSNIKQKVDAGPLSSLSAITLLKNVGIKYINTGDYNASSAVVLQQSPNLPQSSIIFDIHSLRVATAAADSLDLNPVFQNALEVYLVLDKNSTLLDKIGHKLNAFPSIGTMVIANYHSDHFEYEASIASTEQILEPVPCLHIRDLSLEMSEDNSDWWMYSSLMTIFTKLDNLSILYSKTPTHPSNPPPTTTTDLRPRLSSDIAFEFLDYLMQIPDHYIECLYVEDLKTVLKGWRDLNFQFEILDLTYIWRKEEDDDEATCLSLWADGVIYKTCIHYASTEGPCILPDELGLIDSPKSQIIKFDMGFDPFLLESELNVVDNPMCDLSTILFNCRDVHTLHISHTALSILKPNLILKKFVTMKLRKLKIAHSLIDASFLSRLSDSVFHLDRLTIDKCKFVGGGSGNSTYHHFIDMPTTNIKEIVFGFNTTEPVKEFFLKVENLKTGNVVFFQYSHSKLVPCSKSSFDNPGVAPSLSVSSVYCHRINFSNSNIKDIYFKT